MKHMVCQLNYSAPCSRNFLATGVSKLKLPVQPDKPVYGSQVFIKLTNHTYHTSRGAFKVTSIVGTLRLSGINLQQLALV